MEKLNICFVIRPEAFNFVMKDTSDASVGASPITPSYCKSVKNWVWFTSRNLIPVTLMAPLDTKLSVSVEELPRTVPLPEEILRLLELVRT
jgi:hypothetical protein